jgi:hypothetical protein
MVILSGRGLMVLRVMYFVLGAATMFAAMVLGVI